MRIGDSPKKVSRKDPLTKKKHISNALDEWALERILPMGDTAFVVWESTYTKRLHTRKSLFWTKLVVSGLAGADEPHKKARPSHP